MPDKFNRMPGNFKQRDQFLAAALVCFGVAVWPMTPQPVSSVAGVMLSFLLVGAICAVAILPPRHAVSFVVGFTSVTASALASGIIGGLLLNFLPGGLTRTHWLIYSAIVCGIGYGIARMRGADGLFRWRRVDLTAVSWTTGVKLGAVVALIVAAVLVSVHSNNAKDQYFSELWLVPNNSTNSPVKAIDATLGIKNNESSSQRYTMVYDSGKSEFTTKFTLAPLQKMTKKVYVEGDQASALLYLGDAAVGEPYRTVWVARR